MPQEAHITASEEWFTGADKVLQYTVVDSAGVAVNITGWSLRWVMVRKQAASAAASGHLVSKETGGAGIAITNGASGICQVTITDADTDGMEGGETPLYQYELRRTDPGSEDVLAYGNVTLRQGLVR